jgi:hypothetical protein
MANWKYKIDVKDEWKRAKAGELKPCELAEIMANRLAPIVLEIADAEVEDIMGDFEVMRDDKEATFDDFDEILERLYDWGDQGDFHNKTCWIGTF